MCGIVAISRASGGLAGPELTAPLEAIRHRGPDGVGHYRSPDRTVLLGHRRLAVVNPSGGGQPIATEGGRVQVVVAGEFYEHRQIAAELARRGRVLTGSDSAIVAHLYALDGLAALERLRGEFSFVLWDERRRRLVAARDRFGIKPLYVARVDGALVLASEVKALFAAGVPARWDLDALADHLQFALAPDATVFAGVRQVPPGSLLVADASGVRVERYWDLDFPRIGEPGGTAAALEEHVEVVRNEVADAVLVRTDADVPVGYHLSSGLDSSAVAALAAAHRAQTSFTVGFTEPGFDESAAAGEMAAELGLNHHRVPVGPDQTAAAMSASLRAGEMIQENSHGIARYLQSAAIRRHGFVAVQAGEGGDELFLGYPQTLRDLRLTLNAEEYRRAARACRQLGAAGSATLDGFVADWGVVPGWVLERHMAVARPLRPLLRPDFASRMDARDSAAPVLADAADQLEGRSFLHRSQYLFFRTWLANYILAAERLDMAHAVEVRLPLLDHHLFEAVRRTPLSWYEYDGRPKYLLRAALRNRLPPAVEARGKQPFFGPPPTVDRSVFSTLRALIEVGLDHNPVFDPARVRAAIDRLENGSEAARAGAGRLVMIVASVCVLTHEFGLSA